MNRQNGKIDISNLNIPPEKHELATAKIFARIGKDIEFIQSSNIVGNHTPDFWMDDKKWEVKSPLSKGRRTIEKLFSDAVKQSKYLIFDLRRSNMPEDFYIGKIKKETEMRKYIRKVKIILKDGTVVDIK